MDERQRRHIESAILMITLDDKAEEALRLAEELTRKEMSDGFVPHCPWCDTTEGTKDGLSFVHKPDCKWKRFRAFFEED
jgi:hypothetical protein